MNGRLATFSPNVALRKHARRYLRQQTHLPACRLPRRLHQIIQWSLVLSIMLSTQSMLFVQGLFVLRQDFVIANLCENRLKPSMKCHGKCYLKQRMADDEQERDERRAQMFEWLSSLTFWSDAPLSVASAAPQTTSWSPLDQSLRTQLHDGGIFRPPRLSG